MARSSKSLGGTQSTQTHIGTSSPTSVPADSRNNGGSTEPSKNDVVSALAKLPVTSPRKLEANRRNAQHSTGPRTPEGKQRSRRNALKHGILSSIVVVNDRDACESQAEFDQLHRDLIDHYQPGDAYEQTLVQLLAAHFWDERRCILTFRGLIAQGLLQRRRNIEGRPGLLASVFPELYRLQMPDAREREWQAESEALKDHLALPLNRGLTNLTRYRATNERAIRRTIDELDRAQERRRRKERKTAAIE